MHSIALWYTFQSMCSNFSFITGQNSVDGMWYPVWFTINEFDNALYVVYIILEDIWPKNERTQLEEEPDWVRVEREGFSKHRDRDGNGRLNKEEIQHWILPEGYDHARSEAKHLIYNADTNKVQSSCIINSWSIAWSAKSLVTVFKLLSFWLLYTLCIVIVKTTHTSIYIHIYIYILLMHFCTSIFVFVCASHHLLYDWY